MVTSADLPGWLKPMNQVVVKLQHLGFAFGPVHLLTVHGRASGVMRTNPVSPLTLNGQRYLVAGVERADWVANVRAAGRGVLARGKREEPVALVELPVAERGAILREFPRLVPGGVAFFQGLYALPKDRTALPDAFAALADRCPVFRVEPLAS